MKLKMRDDDRRAIDILLDRTAVAAGKAHGVPIYAAADGLLRERVARVEKVLGMLDNMMDSEPPRNLVVATLRFIEHSTGEKLARVRHPGHGMSHGQHSHPA